LACLLGWWLFDIMAASIAIERSSGNRAPEPYRQRSDRSQSLPNFGPNAGLAILRTGAVGALRAVGKVALRRRAGSAVGFVGEHHESEQPKRRLGIVEKDTISSEFVSILKRTRPQNALCISPGREGQSHIHTDKYIQHHNITKENGERMHSDKRESISAFCGNAISGK
jgi:hypothetical protein